MNRTERKAAALAVFEDCAMLMENLHARWTQEHEYENIDDYGPPLALKVQARGGVFMGMTKRPFGFRFRMADGIYSCFISDRSYGYKLAGRAYVHQ